MLCGRSSTLRTFNPQSLLRMKSPLKKLLLVGMIASVSGLGIAFAASASENFASQCARCHGADGKGQTKVGKKLNVRDMTTDEYKKALNDAAAVASLKEGMKKDGKEIKRSYASDFSDAELKALIEYVRALK
jgi:cytochrome c6